MALNLDGKIFRSVANSENGDVGAETRFHYHQEGDLVFADYAGGQIIKGHLLGRCLADGRLRFYYHHVNAAHEVMVGRCVSTPEVLVDGRLRFLEQWQWLSGDGSAGESEVEEVGAGFADEDRV